MRKSATTDSTCDRTRRAWDGVGAAPSCRIADTLSTCWSFAGGGSELASASAQGAAGEQGTRNWLGPRRRPALHPPPLPASWVAMFSPWALIPLARPWDRGAGCCSPTRSGRLTPLGWAPLAARGSRRVAARSRGPGASSGSREYGVCKLWAVPEGVAPLSRSFPCLGGRASQHARPCIAEDRWPSPAGLEPFADSDCSPQPPAQARPGYFGLAQRSTSQ